MLDNYNQNRICTFRKKNFIQIRKKEAKQLQRNPSNTQEGKQSARHATIGRLLHDMLGGRSTTSRKALNEVLLRSPPVRLNCKPNGSLCRFADLRIRHRISAVLNGDVGRPTARENDICLFVLFFVLVADCRCCRHTSSFSSPSSSFLQSSCGEGL